MLCRKDRKKEMFVVMLIRYDCVTKESCRYGIVCVGLVLIHFRRLISFTEREQQRRPGRQRRGWLQSFQLRR